MIPAPALTVAPLTKPVPSIVTASVEPVAPWLGVIAVTLSGAVAVVTACAVVPSENVAVTVSVKSTSELAGGVILRLDRVHPLTSTDVLPTAAVNECVPSLSIARRSMRLLPVPRSSPPSG